MTPSTVMARVMLDALVAHGVVELVLAPGSRSAALALAALDAARREPGSGLALRVHVRIDERSAGFLALGLAKASGEPVAVVTTSGSAVANLHPAVLEAHHAGVPLVLLTADRPPELRGVGANQTTDQIKLFGGAVRHFHEVGAPRREPGQVQYWRNLVGRAVAVARGDRGNDPGPVHLNVALPDPVPGPDEPGPGQDVAWPEPIGRSDRSLRNPPRHRLDACELEPGPRTVVIAGDGSGPAARRLSESAGWPLLAEPSSGARAGPYVVGPYRLMLDHPRLGGAVERVVMYGTPSLSRQVRQLLGRADLELVIVSERACWPDPTRRARQVVPAVTSSRGDSGSQPDAWLSRWIDASAAATSAVDALLDAEPDLTGPLVARVTAASLAPRGVLFAGSSSPIRDLDLAMHPIDRGLDGPSGAADIDVLANRGLSGIDGGVSTAIGAALASQRREDRPVIALLGDLTFLHDASGLVIGPDDPRPDLTLVVVNDNGGGLFHTLEHGTPEHSNDFERVFGTPHGVDLAALCAATHTPYERASSPDALASALASSAGIRVVEAPVDRSRVRDLHRRLAAAVDEALAGSVG